jgi:subtilisin family serine protease
MKSKKTLFAALLAGVSILLVFGLGAQDFRSQRQKRHDRRSSVRTTPRFQDVKRVRRLVRSGYATDRVLVKFKDDLPREYVESLIQAYRFQETKRLDQIDYYVLRTPFNATVEETLYALRRNPDVEQVSPDYRISLTAIPNDPYFRPFQYALHNNGGILDIAPDIQPQMTSGADIKARNACDETEGDETVIIAILDSGVDRDHPELANKVISPGRDFVNDDFDADDDQWHGTHVAGIAAAETNNGEGIAGVSWHSMILPVKVVDSAGDGWYSWLIEGMIWAVDNGAKVMNLSVGGDVDDYALEQACQYAFDNGVLVVASSGNDGDSVLYPGAYDNYVLAVAATDYDDERIDFSNYGSQVDVGAPGVYILGPVPEETVEPGFLPYLFASGTSQAAPHVAGFGALIMSLKPWLTVRDIMNIIRYTADDVNASEHQGRDDYLGYGRINMERALVPTILE